MNRYYYIPILLSDTSQRKERKSRIRSQIDGLVWAYPCGYAFLEFIFWSVFRALLVLRDPFNNLCLLKVYLYNPIGCVKPVVATEPGKVYIKEISILLVFYIRFVFVNDQILSEFFLTWWTVGIIPTFCLCGPKR